MKYVFTCGINVNVFRVYHDIMLAVGSTEVCIQSIGPEMIAVDDYGPRPTQQSFLPAC